MGACWTALAACIRLHTIKQIDCGKPPRTRGSNDIRWKGSYFIVTYAMVAASPCPMSDVVVSDLNGRTVRDTRKGIHPPSPHGQGELKRTWTWDLGLGAKRLMDGLSQKLAWILHMSVPE